MKNTQGKIKKRVAVIVAVVVVLAVFFAVLLGSEKQPSGQSVVSETTAAVSMLTDSADDETVTEAAVTDEAAFEVETSHETAKQTETKNKETSQTDKIAPEAKTEDKKDNEKNNQKTCILTIKNGAASANTKEAVNGLHVYDPNSKDLEDFFSGAEVPVGTTISIYVYNLASPVSLHVEHNGKTIADRSYSIMEAWVDDDKVEFINLKLEGDLVVETKALSSKEKADSSIAINNEALGVVQVGKSTVEDGDALRNGTNDIIVKRANTDVNVTVTVDGTLAGTAKLTAQNASYVIKKVVLNNSKLKVVFDPVNKNEKLPEAPKKSSIKISGGSLAKVYRGKKSVKNGDKISYGTYNFKVTSSKKDIQVTLSVGKKVIGKKKINGGMNSYTFKKVKVNGKVKIKIKDVTPKAVKSKFTVTIENKVAKKDATLTVGYVNAKEEAVNIISGKKYKKELMIGARALNMNSSRELKLTAYNSKGKKVDSVIVKKGTKSNPGANGFYLVLTDDIRYVLEYADTEKETGEQEPETREPQTREPETTGEGTSEPATEETTFAVVVENHASEANSDVAVNGLHVYDTEDPDLQDIEGHASLKKGSKIRIFAYPLASDIHLTIVHNGTVIADKEIKKMIAWEDDDKIEYFDLVLAGELQVTASVVKSTEPGTSGE